MQVVEQVGGTFLLQKTAPVALCGALTIVTSGPDTGWLLASLSSSGSEFSCEVDADRVSLKMSLDVAVRFASTLLVLASTALSELREHGTADVGELEIGGRPGKKELRWASMKGSPDIKLVTEGDSTEVRIRATLAAALAFRILRQAGQISARPEQSG